MTRAARPAPGFTPDAGPGSGGGAEPLARAEQARPLRSRAFAPEPGPLRELEFPRIERRPLDNGLSVLALPHGDLPLVAVEVVARAGADAEPATKGGLAYLVGESLEAGTATRSAERLAWEVERLGAELAVHVGWDATTVGLTVHRDRLEPALELLADVVRNPSFPDDEVRRQRDLQLAALLRRLKEPGSLANDMAARFIFHEDVPYSRSLLGRISLVEGITRADLVAFYRERYVPAGGAVVLVGAIRPEEARAAAARHFGDWRGEAAPPAAFDVAPAVEETSVFVVHRPGAVQSEIRIGDVGVPRHHPDYFAITVLNTLLGGAFTSRLNMSLRERHGFTYGARSAFAFRRLGGPFSVDVAVATEVTAPAVREALAVVRTLREEGPREDELTGARDYMAGVLPLRLQTVGQVAARVADVFVHELPPDYLQAYPDRIRAVRGEDVARVARERLRPDRLAIVVVGDADKIAEPLRELGVGPIHVETPDEGGRA